jgi:hypothetical protein
VQIAEKSECVKLALHDPCEILLDEHEGDELVITGVQGSEITLTVDRDQMIGLGSSETQIA